MLLPLLPADIGAARRGARRRLSGVTGAGAAAALALALRVVSLAGELAAVGVAELWALTLCPPGFGASR
jgi:hypothetical protein